MLTTIGAIKLSKKEWNTVTNILFVYPLMLISMIIKITVQLFAFIITGTINVVKWLINTISNANNAPQKTPRHKKGAVNKNKTGFETESFFKDGKAISIFLLVVLLIISVMISAASHTDTDQEQNGNGDKQEINDSTNTNGRDYSEFAFNEVEGGYQMVESYKLFRPNCEGELVIPETYNGKPVVEIDNMDSWFGRGITKLIGSKNLIIIRHATLASRDQSPMPNMTEVIFPADGKLKSIETHAFYWQNSLKTVILPSQFEHFEDGVFERCFALENLVIYNTVPPQMEGDIFNSDGNLMNDEKWHTKPNKDFIVYVPDDAVETYKNSIWEKYTIKPISEADFLK